MTPLRFRAFDKEHGIMMSHEDIDHSDKEGLIMWGELFNGREKEIFVMQSTGRYDQNSVEVFELDILKNALGTDKWIVEWHGGGFHLVALGFPKTLPMAFLSKLVVIGNELQNPDLLPKAA